MLSDAVKAYGAALVDGEGCIGMYNTRTKLDKRAAHYQLTVRIAMKSGAPILWMHKHFGGALTTQKTDKSKGSNHIYYVIQWRNKKAEAFLAEILPFLVEKGNQAKLAMEFCEHRRAMHQLHKPWLSVEGKRGGHRYPQEVLDSYDGYVTEFKTMKRNYSDPLQLN
jgi:hypothetical protein